MYDKKFFEVIREFFAKANPRQEIRFILLGAFVGAGSAFLAIIFRKGINSVTHFLFSAAEGNNGIPFWLGIANLSWWQLILPPIICGSFVAGLTKVFAPESQGHGVPEIIQAVTINRGIIRLRVTIIKMIASIFSIGSGFSVGREGPTALIGASFGSYIGQLLKLSTMRMRMVVACGAAGGIAATFNAPLAGTAFAIELIMRGVQVRYFTPIFLSAMTGTVCSHYFLGNEHELFTKVFFELRHPLEILTYIILGTFAGLWGVLFTRILYKCEEFDERLRLNPWIKGAIGGLGVGLTLIFIPWLSGPATWDVIRYPLDASLSGQGALFLLLLSILKMISTSWSLAMGGSGGVFAPSLVIGGSMGASFGFLVNKFLPTFIHSSPAGFSLLGMGAIVAGVTQAPLTAITIIFELTNNQAIILPIIVSSAFAYGIYNHFMLGSIYTLKLQKRGIFLDYGKESGVLSGLTVEKISQDENEFFYEDMHINEVVRYFKDSSRTTLPVLSKNRQIKGIISFWDLSHLKDEILKNPDMKISNFMNKEFKYVTSKDNLYTAFNIISSGDFEYLPVVENAQNMMLHGRLTRGRLLQAYRNALTARGIIEE